jgi:hypothetical protein
MRIEIHMRYTRPPEIPTIANFNPSADFRNFLIDVGERPGPNFTIDRINNNGDYEPENCRWATASERRKNQKAA